MKRTKNYCKHIGKKDPNYAPYKSIDADVIRDIIEYATEKSADKPLFQIPVPGKDDVFVSYGEFGKAVEGFGTFLFSEGYKKEKIAILGENCYEWIVSYFSIVDGGNTAVPLDRDLPCEDLIYHVTNGDCAAVIYSPVYADVAEKLLASSEKIKKIYCMSDLESMVSEGKKLVQNGDKSFKNADVKPDDLAAIVYTSGTTGKSKGVMLTQHNISSNVSSVCRHIQGEGHGVLALPLHHTFGMLANVLAPMLFEARIYMTTSMRNIQSDMKKIGATAAFCVPLMAELIYKKVWQTAKKTGRDEILKKGIKISNFLIRFGIDVRRKLFKEVHAELGGNLELIICGGAPLSEKIAFELGSMGISVLNGYGITECSPVVAVNRNMANHYGSVGTPLDCNEVMIHDPGEDGIGEIYVKGTNVMVGYYNDEAATRDAFDGDWLKTGDLGYIDGDGFLYVTGRLKNLIILSNGKNVSAEELEEKLMSEITYISEVVVSEENDKIMAEVLLDEEADADAKEKIKDDIKKLNANLPSYKRIGQTKIRDEAFEKTTSLKIKRSYKNNGGK